MSVFNVAGTRQPQTYPALLKSTVMCFSRLPTSSARRSASDWNEVSSGSILLTIHLQTLSRISPSMPYIFPRLLAFSAASL